MFAHPARGVPVRPGSVFWRRGCLEMEARPASASTSGAPEQERDMTAADDGRPDDPEGRSEQAAGALAGDGDLDRDGQVDHGVTSVKQHVDRVADKVKGLLRSRD